MSLQNSIGYVRLAISTGFDEKSMTVNWMTFSNTDWKESNPEKVFGDIVEMGSHTFQLAITEKQINPETNEEEDVVIGYLPQSMEQAHLLLRNLDVQGARFINFNFEITGVEIDGETKEEEEIKPLWKPDLKILKGEVFQFFDGESWGDYEALQDHVSQKDWVPNKSPSLFVKVATEGSVKIWESGIQVIAGAEYLYKETTYIVLQSHTTQVGWEPDKLASLWKLK